MNGFGKIRDHIFLRGGPLHIGEKEGPSLPLQPPPQFLQNAGLSHSALAGHHDVIPVPDTGFEHSQFAIPVEEVVAADPAACG